LFIALLVLVLVNPAAFSSVVGVSEDDARSAMIASVAILSIAALASALIGYGLWRVQTWARVLLIILSVIVLLAGAFNTLAGGLSRTTVASMLLAVIYLVVLFTSGV